jgi:3-hydroxyisobutyrate dehydrogenase-like beta-hydroxyacid dehydrogenase
MPSGSQDWDDGSARSGDLARRFPDHRLQQFGIDSEDAYVLAGGVMASPFVLYKRGASTQTQNLLHSRPTGLMRKDLALDDDLATRLEVRMPVARVATSILEETIEHDLQKQTRLRYAC